MVFSITAVKCGTKHAQVQKILNLYNFLLQSNYMTFVDYVFHLEKSHKDFHRHEDE